MLYVTKCLFNTFQHNWITFMVSLFLSVCWYVRALSDNLGLRSNLYIVLMFIKSQSVSKMNCLAFIIHLQRKSNVFRCITVSGKNLFKCILMMLHHFKHNVFHMHLWSALKQIICRIWDARHLLLVYSVSEKNSVI